MENKQFLKAEESEEPPSTNKRLRVLMFSIHTDPKYDIGGQNVSVFNWGKKLAEKGVSIDVFTRKKREEYEDIEEITKGFRIIRIKCQNYDDIPKEFLFSYVKDFIESCQEFFRENGFNYDVIHGHYWIEGYVSDYFSKLYDKPFVFTFRGIGAVKKISLSEKKNIDLKKFNFEQRLQIEKKCVDDADVIIALSKTERKYIEILYEFKNQEKIKVIRGSGIDINTFKKIKDGKVDRLREKFGLKNESIVLYAGRLVWGKGITYLVRAAPKIIKKLQGNVKFILVGEGDFKNSLQKLVRSLGIENYFIFQNYVPNEKMPLFYSLADVCVLPSLFEIFGRVIVESMACGTPLVVTRVGGPSEIVKENINSLAVEKRQANSLAMKVSRILLNPELKEKLSQAAQKRSKRYSLNYVVRSLIKVYRNLKSKKMVVFDIDKTLISEDGEDFTEVNKHLKKLNKKVILCFATARTYESAIKLFDKGLFRPKFLITDIGTEIYKKRRSGVYIIDRLWQQKILNVWDNKFYDVLTKILIDGLDIKDTVFCYRVSYTTRNEKDQVKILRSYLRKYPLKVIYNHKRDVSVIPDIAGKGNAILYLTRKLNLSKKNIFVFGDSEADFDMFKQSFGYNFLMPSALKELKERFKKMFQTQRPPLRAHLDSLPSIVREKRNNLYKITKHKGAQGIINELRKYDVI